MAKRPLTDMEVHTLLHDMLMRLLHIEAQSEFGNKTLDMVRKMLVGFGAVLVMRDERGDSDKPSDRE